MGLFGSQKKNDRHEAAAPETATLSDGAVVRVARRVDCLGDSCPRPQLLTRKALGEVASTEVIEVVLDNPSSVEALPPMCGPLGAHHLETVKSDRCWRVYIRKN